MQLFGKFGVKIIFNEMMVLNSNDENHLCKTTPNLRVGMKETQTVRTPPNKAAVAPEWLLGDLSILVYLLLQNGFLKCLLRC